MNNILQFYNFKLNFTRNSKAEEELRCILEWTIYIQILLKNAIWNTRSVSVDI